MQYEVITLRSVAFSDLEAAHVRAQEAVSQGTAQAILLVAEPKATFTAGRAAKDSDLLWDETELSRNAVTTAQVGRGGNWTYHGPGQIVVYPVVRLKDLNLSDRGIRVFLNRLRNAVRQTVCSLGVDAIAGDEPFGVYTQGRKLCSFGIAVKRGITSHGLSLYHSPQASAFAGIHPCGVPGALPLSLQECGVQESWEAVASQLVDSIKKGLISTESQIA